MLNVVLLASFTAVVTLPLMSVSLLNVVLLASFPSVVTCSVGGFSLPSFSSLATFTLTTFLSASLPGGSFLPLTSFSWL